ncbi:MAG: PilZ domain-containing protein [Candidatus Omnitrophota bacterium]
MNQERRSYPRVSINLAVNIKGENFDFAVETKNISASGIYCQVGCFVPLMTKLSLRMYVPLIINEKKEDKQINCSAVVVRVEPGINEELKKYYNLALFFNDISENDQILITKYINQAFFAGNN